MIENTFNKPQLLFQPLGKCPNCQGVLPYSLANYCSLCRYPLIGDDRDQLAFERREIFRIQKYHSSIKKIKRVKTLLKVLVWFMLGFGVVLLFFDRFGYGYSLALVILGFTYLGLLRFFRRDTFLALVSSLGFYIILGVIDLSLSAELFLRGSLIRIVVILILIQGIQGYKDFIKL